jgi:hypothetical protein
MNTEDCESREISSAASYRLRGGADDSPMPDVNAESLKGRANELFKMQKYIEAISLYSQAIGTLYKRQI